MAISELRTLVSEINLSAHGVAATVTRPAPDDTPVETTVIWLTPKEDQPGGSDFARLDPQRVLAIPRADLSTMPRGTTIAAAEADGGATKTWARESLDRSIDPHFWYVMVKELG